MHDT
jgi:hypothetical protein